MNTDKKFLALTALEQFWDTSLPILFLGDWCKDYAKKNSWKDVNGEVLEIPKLSYLDSYEAYQYAMQIYEKLLPKIVDWLNEFHKTSHSFKYWRLLVGPFLFWYTQVVYQRYLYLQTAFDEYSHLETWGLAKDSFFTCINTNEFLCHAWHSDALNLQIFTQLLDLFFKKPIIYKSYTWESEFQHRNLNFSEVNYRPRTKWIIWILRAINKLQRCQKVGVLGGIPKQDLLKMMINSSFSILPILPATPINRGQILGRSFITENKINLEKRMDMLTISTDNELARLIVHTLPVNMPINFMEGYQEEVDLSRKYFPFSSQVIVSEQVASYDQYKFWMGDQIEKGAKIVGTQHGGCYGMQKASSAEYVECQASDVFVSWGWGPIQNVLPAPLTLNRKFIKNYSRTNNQNNYNDIIWIATISHYRYQLSIHSWSILSKPYLTDQRNFFNKLNKDVASKIIMRVNPSTPNINEIREYVPDVNFHFPDNRDSFFEQIKKAKIVLIDNCSTTFLYTLAFNIPTILFWDKNYWVFRDEAKPYLEDLESVGIYHNSPTKAAEMLNRIVNDPLSWWNSTSVQEVRQKFCNQFVKTSKTYVREWKNLLLNLNFSQS